MSMDELLKELQLEYIDSLAQKIQEIQTQMNSNDLNGLINSFHKLKGSGKTYGLGEVSILGEFFESWLKEKGTKVLPFVTQSLLILARIEQSRKNQSPYNITQDPDFKKLESLK